MSPEPASLAVLPRHRLIDLAVGVWPARGKMAMDLNSLAVFAKVAEASSFSEAARRLKMPISTVSRRIAELEEELGVRLIERTTRSLRVTEVGTEVLQHAQRATEIGEAVESIVSNKMANVQGTLRLSAPPSISDTLLAPLIGAFQAIHPEVRFEVFVANRIVDHLAEGIDLVFRVGTLKDSALVARRILTYRHQLVASPAYLESRLPPTAPQHLLEHRLLAFSHRAPANRWTFLRRAGDGSETIEFTPYIAMNDFAGLAPALEAGVGIGVLPPIVQPHLLREGRLIEVMTDWRLRSIDLSLVHVANKHLPRSIRAFKDFAVEMAPKLFDNLPT